MEKPDQIDRYEMSDIFISYDHEDKTKAEWLAEALKYKDLSVWLDRHITPGKPFAQVIEEELDAANCVVVLWSNNSVKSEWVLTEASEGMRRGILIPVLIEDVIIPLEFRRIQAAVLIDWDGKSPHAGVCKLVEAVIDFLDRHTLRRQGMGGYYGQVEEKARLKEQREEGENKRVKVEGPQWRWVYQNIPLLILAVAMLLVLVVIFPEVSKIAVMATDSKTALLVGAILVVLAVIGAIGYILVSSAPEGGWTVERFVDAIKDKFQGGRGL
jgi:hypothetical protein